MKTLRMVVAVIAGLGLSMLGLMGHAHAQDFFVTSSGDSGSGTLRAAIAASNTTTGVQRIVFSITDPITLATPLLITAPIVIEGAGVTVGASGPSSVDALRCNSGSDGSILRNLAVINSHYAITLTSDNNRVLGCALGIDWVDSDDVGNNVGVIIYGDGNEIGGSQAGEGNVVSGNTGYGLDNRGNRLRVRGNYIGTARDGQTAIPNAIDGIRIAGGMGSMIGGNSLANEGNLISGNVNGIEVANAYSAASGNSICGNVIGLNLDQTQAVPNTGFGLQALSTQSLIIGLPMLGYGNVIAGNALGGIYLAANVQGTVVQNNLIGISALNTSFGTGYGIRLYTAGGGALIGGRQGAEFLERNVISGNVTGIELSNDGNTITGNFIGTDIDGVSARPNTVGISINGKDNYVGGVNNVSQNYGNIISGNTYQGIYLNRTGNTPMGNSVVGNYIGLDVTGLIALPNQYGVEINSSVWCPNYIGAADPDLANIISANTQYGIRISNLTAGQVVKGNRLGLNKTGSMVLANYAGAVHLDNAVQCQLGGLLAADKNIFCGSGGYGILLENNATGNTIAGNWLGLLPGGTQAPVTFTQNIVLQGGAQGNLIGYSGLGIGNTLVGGNVGIYMANSLTQGNGLFATIIRGFAVSGITLATNSNNNKTKPVVLTAANGTVSGSAVVGDAIQVFRAEHRTGNGGSLEYLGSTIADGAGDWTLSVTALSGDYICALATDGANNTSEFSVNLRMTGPTATTTPYLSPTPTMTQTQGIVLGTRTMTPTMTQTPTRAETPSVTATPSITLTITETVIVTPSVTFTITPTSSITPTETCSPTISPTPTITPTPSMTSTITPTPKYSLSEVDLTGKLFQAFPNPAKDYVKFVMHLDHAVLAKLVIYNLAGDRVATVSAPLPAGRGQVIVWQCQGIAPGVYVADICLEGKRIGQCKLAISR